MYPTQIVINLIGGVTVRGVSADYHEMDGGVEKPVGRRIIKAADVETVLPTTAQLLAQIAELQEQVETIKAERDDAVSARDSAEANHNTAIAAKEEEHAHALAALQTDLTVARGEVALQEARVTELEAQIAALTAPPPVVKTYMSDLWRRATDAEGEAIEAIIAALPAKQRGHLNSVSYLDHADEQFPAIQAALTQAFGAERAGELLAPSSN